MTNVALYLKRVVRREDSGPEAIVRSIFVKTNAAWRIRIYQSIKSDRVAKSTVSETQANVTYAATADQR